jgi:hypothetical protein
LLKGFGVTLLALASLGISVCIILALRIHFQLFLRILLCFWQALVTFVSVTCYALDSLVTLLALALLGNSSYTNA